MSERQTWQGLQDELTARRSALNAEIAIYPGPITACDAQFNHLLEQRVGINAELKLLAGISESTDANSLKQFVEACPFLGDSGGEIQQ